MSRQDAHHRLSGVRAEVPAGANSNQHFGGYTIDEMTPSDVLTSPSGPPPRPARKGVRSLRPFYCCPNAATALGADRPRAHITCKRRGDRRGSNPQPPLEPQSGVTRYSAGWCVRSLGLFMGFSTVLSRTLVRCVL